jgi:hypothetical protein
MTLYKIFKENEEEINQINFASVFGTNSEAEIYFKQLFKAYQLDMVDGVIAMVEEQITTNKEFEKGAFDEHFSIFFSGCVTSLSDLKDKLLDDRQLINDNK